MRLVAINQSLWLDEAIGAIAVKTFSYSGLLTDFLKSDNHPPLYYLALKVWTDLFGYSEVSLRMPSVIFGVLTVYVTYLIARKLESYLPVSLARSVGGRGDLRVTGKKSFAILSALLLATSPFHIYYSQEARMYSMAAFLASLVVYSFLHLVDERVKKVTWWLVFSFATAALIFTDYVPVFLLPVFWLYALSKKMKKDWWAKFIFSHAPLLALGILWLPTLLIQAEKGKWLMETLPGWRQVAGGATFKQAALVWMKVVLGRISFSDKFFYYTLIMISSVPFAISLLNALRERKKIKLVWLWLVLPLVLGFIASFWFPAFIYFRFLYVVPAFYFLIAWGITCSKFLLKIILVLSVLLVNTVGWLFYILEPYQQREHWREAVAFVEKMATQDEIAIFEFPEPFAPYRWYSKGKVEAVGVTNSISADRLKTAEKTSQTVDGKYGVYYFEYLRDLSDPQRVVEQALRDGGFKAVDVFDYFPGVGQITYWVKK